MMRDLGNRINPANRDHIKRSEVKLDLSKRPQEAMVYKLKNRLGCWKNTLRMRKSLSNSSSVLPTSHVVYQPL